MGLSAMYGKPVEDNEGIALIHYAFKNGVTFFDTSDAYGPHKNEKLLALVLISPCHDRAMENLDMCLFDYFHVTSR